MSKWQATWGAAAIAVLGLVAASTFAATIDRVKAGELKAAYLKQIAALTTWPDTAADAHTRSRTDSRTRPIVIGVLGPDPNGVMAPIRLRMQSEVPLSAQGRRLELLDIPAMGDASDDAAMTDALQACDVLFLSADAEGDWARVKPLLGVRPIVTVSEMASFAREGGMIEYVLDVDGGTLRLIVNLDAIQRTGIVLSSRVLALKNVVVLRDVATP